MKTVIEKANGKINLYLDVLGKREDGYHNILSVMHTVSLHDTVTVTEVEPEGAGVTMSCTDLTLSCGEDNLCLKAARVYLKALSAESDVKTPSYRIHLEKHLPREAGLGGGSADAAAVLRAMNRLCGNRYSEEKLCELGAGIGADVPFCVVGGAYIAEGIGERLSPHPTLPSCYLIICEGEGKMSTPTAYRMLDQTPSDSKKPLAALTEAMTAGRLSAIGEALYNRFEDIVPKAKQTRKILLDAGAVGARMTGSGTAVYGLFEQREEAEKALAVLLDKGRRAFLAVPTEKENFDE